MKYLLNLYNYVKVSCNSELRIQISDAEYDFLIKEFQRSEGLATRNRKQAARNIGSKGIDNRPTSIPGFISEEVTLGILSEIFQVSWNDQSQSIL